MPTSLDLETDIPPVLFIFVVVYPNSGEVSIFSGLLQEAKQHDILLVSSRGGLGGGTLGIGSLGVGSLGIQGRIVTSTEVVSTSSWKAARDNRIHKAYSIFDTFGRTV